MAEEARVSSSRVSNSIGFTPIYVTTFLATATVSAFVLSLLCHLNVEPFHNLGSGGAIGFLVGGSVGLLSILFYFKKNKSEHTEPLLKLQNSNTKETGPAELQDPPEVVWNGKGFQVGFNFFEVVTQVNPQTGSYKTTISKPLTEELYNQAKSKLKGGEKIIIEDQYCETFYLTCEGIIFPNDVQWDQVQNYKAVAFSNLLSEI
jgi:hypothetical protein